MIFRRLSQAIRRADPKGGPPSYAVDDVTLAAAARVVRSGHCDCLLGRTKKGKLRPTKLHAPAPDTALVGWSDVQRYLQTTAESGSPVFEPDRHTTPAEWAKIITLPAEIGRLRRVREVRLYGSHLMYVPPEIGGMADLEELDIYTSYSLHWLPYELTRCGKLRESRMSTRTLYGNRNTLLPFPRLSEPKEQLLPQDCSICGSRLTSSPKLYWTTQRVGSDDAPLLIHACSETCIERVPDAPQYFHPGPHKGGGAVGMPVPRHPH